MLTKNGKSLCQKLINGLEKKPYFSIALKAYKDKLNEILSDGTEITLAVKVILNHLNEIMHDAQPLVEVYIQSRVESGEIKSADQARKSAAGNIFQQMFAYILAMNVIVGNLSDDLVVTTSVKSIIDEYAAIKVDDDIQQPDSDVLLYSTIDKNSPIINFSCKTSCRERAGQTYKWKLLADIATCNCPYVANFTGCLVNKYKISYKPIRQIKMFFVTTDFYDELSNPQISGMFSFFDNTYVAKTKSSNRSIKTLDKVIEDINQIFCI